MRYARRAASRVAHERCRCRCQSAADDRELDVSACGIVINVSCFAINSGIASGDTRSVKYLYTSNRISSGHVCPFILKILTLVTFSSVVRNVACTFATCACCFEIVSCALYSSCNRHLFSFAVLRAWRARAPQRERERDRRAFLTNFF